MERFLRFDISIFSVILLFIIMMTMKLRKDTISTSSRLMQRLIWINIYMLLLEVLSWQFDMKSGAFNWYANYTTNMLFAWSTPIITCAWASYLDYHLYGSYERLKKRWFYIQPLVINSVFIIINFFQPFIFSVSSENVYQREPFMWLIVVVNTLTFFYICYLAYKKKESINKEILIVLLMYTFMPVLAAGIQVLVYGAFILWPTMAITVVLTYIFLETVSTSKDYLTGLVSRHRMDDYLEYMLEQKNVFTLVMIDLNDFKMINDTYGHVKGDIALQVFSKALKEVFHQAKLVSRYAGDEFVLILEKYTEKEILDEFDKLRDNLFVIQQSKELPFLITFSYGYHLNDPSKDYNYQTIMNITDLKMYEHKEHVKKLEREK
ncbi:MAG: GGDEF domain-containing protein [Clostridiales bacterium]|nr:GGDEF domain-containing protein [Clostridiales bacterium]